MTLKQILSLSLTLVVCGCAAKEITREPAPPPGDHDPTAPTSPITKA